jgi:transposase
MIKAGKPPKVALTALMRKLIELANTLIKADRKLGQKGGLIKTGTFHRK